MGLDFLRRVGAGIWGYVAVALAVLAALLLALAKAKKAGKDEVIAETATKEVDNAKQANKIEDEVSAARPDDVRERLRKYRRD
jgi:hypothetical protein